MAIGSFGRKSCPTQFHLGAHVRRSSKMETPAAHPEPRMGYLPGNIVLVESEQKGEDS